MSPDGPDHPIPLDRDLDLPSHARRNAYIELFNVRLRPEFLNASWFLSIADARQRTESWRKEYN